VRQIAQHFDCRFKVASDGNEKEISIMKPDFTIFEVKEAEQDAKSKEIESLKDALLQSQLCLGLTQKTLSVEQRRNQLLTRELMKRSDSGQSIPRRERMHDCTHCETRQVSHAVFPCGHLFCGACAEEARLDRSCHACSEAVEGVLLMESQPESKKARI